VVGQEIKRGERLGLVGSTGRSTGPHLHYEVRIGEVAVSPRHYLPER
jgi:murein DD-endopeptidase MepM/ murein hydrolase activator NlpD